MSRISLLVPPFSSFRTLNGSGKFKVDHFKEKSFAFKNAPVLLFVEWPRHQRIFLVCCSKPERKSWVVFFSVYALFYNRNRKRRERKKTCGGGEIKKRETFFQSHGRWKTFLDHFKKYSRSQILSRYHRDFGLHFSFVEDFFLQILSLGVREAGRQECYFQRPRRGQKKEKKCGSGQQQQRWAGRAKQNSVRKHQRKSQWETGNGSQPDKLDWLNQVQFLTQLRDKSRF